MLFQTILLDILKIGPLRSSTIRAIAIDLGYATSYDDILQQMIYDRIVIINSELKIEANEVGTISKQVPAKKGKK